MDKNECVFIGRIGSKIKKGRTQNGDTYIWLLLQIESAANANSTENNYHQKVHIMCFKKPVIDYLERVEAHTGNRIVIFGFVSSFPDEVKGKAVIVNAINANEIYVIKTKPDN